MFLPQWDHEIQALTTYRSYQAFAVGIRLRCPRRRAQHAQPKGLELIIYFHREDGIAVANKKAVRMIAGNRPPGMLQGPLRRWVRGEIAVQDASSPKFHEEKDVKDSESSGHHDEEIASHHGLSMIADKRLPVLRAGRRGRPTRDFHFQNSLKPLRCQPIRVSGLTITKALFQWNS